MSDATQQAELHPLGAFDLAQSIGFGFGQRAAGSDDVMRLAFCLDGYRQQVGVAVRQPEPGRLTLEIVGDDGLDTDAVSRHVARVLSVDLDGRGYDELGTRVDLLGRAQAARPGLRPPLFYSAYEAALWSVLSARQPHRAMSEARDRLSRNLGRVFVVAGERVAAVPLPERLAELGELPGVREAKIPRLRAVGEAAASGRLDTATLRALDPDVAGTQLQELPGIGPFYAELVTVRALGHTDVLPCNEPMVKDLVEQALGHAEPLSREEFEAVAEAWRPWRTWVVVAVRASAAAMGLTPRIGRLTRGGPA